MLIYLDQNKLFQYYEKHPQQLPKRFQGEENIYRGIADYISGMTDQYAEEELKKL